MTHKILSFFIIAAALAPTVVVGQEIKKPEGDASFYANKFEGKTTASGEIYYHNQLTAAHRTLPFGTMVKVTNLVNNKTVVVRVNDRGPFVEGRIIDLSKSAAEALDFIQSGVVRVRIQLYDPDEEAAAQAALESTQKTEAKGDIAAPQPEAAAPAEPQPAQVAAPAPAAQPAEVAQNAAPASAAVAEPAPEIVNITFYATAAAKVERLGYGLQVGSYEETSNLLERTSEVSAMTDQPVTVKVINTNGAKQYKLIVGNFDSRTKAEYFRDSIREQLQGFVVSF